MLSKNKIKSLKQLHLKKYRDAQKVFLAEGTKLVDDLIRSFHCQTIIATDEWLSKNNVSADEIIQADIHEIKKISLFSTPPEVFAIFNQAQLEYTEKEITSSLSIALDDIQDPGNLGTIIRIADWFGIENIFCSNGCADTYNPKTIQATMGALSRVKVHKVELVKFLATFKNKTTLYGTFLDGGNIYKEKLTKTGIIIMGNEGQGIQAEIEKLIDKKIHIPNFPAERITSESLNVATATAITCSEFRRKVL